MLINQYLYNRALIKQRLKKKKEELNVLSPRTTFDGLSINLQSELSDEKKPDEFKKVVIEDKKDKNKEKEDKKKIKIEEDKDKKEDEDEKEIQEEEQEIQEEEQEVDDDFDDLKEDLELVKDDVDDKVDDDLEEDFELVQDEQNDDLVQENKLLEGGYDSGSEKNKNDKNIKNVVVSFF